MVICCKLSLIIDCNAERSLKGKSQLLSVSSRVSDTGSQQSALRTADWENIVTFFLVFLERFWAPRDSSSSTLQPGGRMRSLVASIACGNCAIRGVKCVEMFNSIDQFV